jgi:hypothetical protein
MFKVPNLLKKALPGKDYFKSTGMLAGQTH